MIVRLDEGYVGAQQVMSRILKNTKLKGEDSCFHANLLVYGKDILYDFNAA